MGTKKEQTEQPEKVVLKSASEIVKMSSDERVSYLTSLGFNPSRLDTSIFGQSSKLPEIGTITDIKTVDYSFDTDGKKETRKGLRIVVKDESGIDHECSLTRAAMRGIVKDVISPVGMITNVKKELDFSDLTFDKNNDVRINGQSLSDLPNSPVLIYDYIGRKIKAEKCRVFTLPFGKSVKNKHEAIDLLTTSDGFKVTLV